MRKLYLMSMFTFIFLIGINIVAVAQWTSQTSPLGTEILGKMQFVSATEGWIACGNSGSLLHTTNAGVQWNAVTPFPTDTPMCNPSDVGLTMSWPNVTHGWALKTYGSLNDPNGATLFQTANGGTDWTKKDFPKQVPSVTYSAADLVGTWQVHALFVDNPSDLNVFNGWAYGSTTIASDGSSSSTTINNQGQTTTRNSTTPFNITSKGRFTVTGADMDGFMSADKSTMIITQTDGGGGYNLVVWQKVNPSTVYSTADLEGTWEMHSIQTQPNASWVDGTTVMDATGNGTTTAVTPNGQVVRGFSGSMSSTGILTSNGTDINGFMSADKQTMFITQTGNSGYFLNVMQKRQSAITYSASDLVGIWQLHGVAIGSSSAAWIHCQYKINAAGSLSATKMLRNNVSMSDVTSSISISSDGTLTGFGSGDAHGFLSADKSIGINTLTDGSGGLYLSIYQKDLSASGDGGMQVQFADNNTGWASVYNSLYGSFKIYKTTNGGTNWDVINGVTNPVGGFYYFVDAMNGWMFGASASTIGSNYDILHTTDGGLSWTTQATNVGLPTAIHFSDLNNGWLVGYNGLVMHTTNGGTQWATVSNSNFISTAKNRSIFAVNSSVCYFLSKAQDPERSYVLKTINGGDSWTSEQLSLNSVYCLYFWDENNGWISGDYGQIAHYTNNTGIQNPLNNDKSVSVYPNPVIDGFRMNGFENNAQFELYTMNGTLVVSKTIIPNEWVSLITFPNGFYVGKLTTNEGVIQQKVIKK